MGLKEKVIGGMAWSFAERFLAQIVSFVVSIVLARLLSPEAYGSIAMVLVFINIANVFATAGLGSALIQKRDADEIDFSTVFYFNIVFSAIIYLVLFLIAPLISSFYNMPDLTIVMRVLGLRIIVAGVNSVQRAYVSRHMIFKKFFFATLGGTLLSAFVGIIMAYLGFGIWALVAQYMTNTITDTIVLWFTVKWRPIIVFSFNRLKKLYSFGWKLLGASLLSSVYIELTDLLIGKVYGSSDLAYYNRGKKFPQLIVAQINSTVDTVLFPAMSMHQDQPEKIKQDVSYSIRFESFCLFPLLFGMAAIAEDLVRLLLTDKWLPATIFIQIACISYVTLPIGMANIQAIKAVGRSDIYLKLDILKKIVGLTMLVIFVNKGVIAIAIADTASNYIGLIMNILPNKRLLGYKFSDMLKDVGPYLLLSSFMFSVVYAFGHFVEMNIILKLVLQVILGFTVYYLVAKLFKLKIMAEVKHTILKFIRRK